jgi:hypothetical protein
LSLDASFEGGARFSVELPATDAQGAASETAVTAQNAPEIQNTVAESSRPE